MALETSLLLLTNKIPLSAPFISPLLLVQAHFRSTIQQYPTNTKKSRCRVLRSIRSCNTVKMPFPPIRSSLSQTHTSCIYTQNPRNSFFWGVWRSANPSFSSKKRCGYLHQIQEHRYICASSHQTSSFSILFTPFSFPFFFFPFFFFFWESRKRRCGGVGKEWPWSAGDGRHNPQKLSGGDDEQQEPQADLPCSRFNLVAGK